MLHVIQSRLSELDVLCKKHRVSSFALFGSAAREQSGSAPNDLDFVVEFMPMPPAQHADCFFGLLEDLERLFGIPVDLIEPAPIRNPNFLEAVEETKVVLYHAA